MRRGWIGAVLAIALLVVALTTTSASAKPKPTSSPTGIDQIGHVVVLMQENRSFDSYFSQLHFEGQPNIDVMSQQPNPNPLRPNGPGIHPFHQTAMCEVVDLDHSWTATHRAFDNGRMDGFTTVNVDPADPTGSRSMGHYNSAELPFYYALANAFAIGDRYFSSVLGPTFPNRFYLTTGTSFGHIRNDIATFNQKTIFQLLDEANPPVTWKIYAASVSEVILFSYVQQHASHIRPISEYMTDAASGTVPQVAFVEPNSLGSVNVENDEHPPANVQVGEKFTHDIIEALLHSPDWSASAFFLTYDEHGGFYDHVAPPPAVPPDDIPPMLHPGDTPAAFDRYGVRVPAIVVSPFAKRHYVSHVVYDHTSILRFIETRFGLPALTRRDAAASPMLDFFDFAHASFATPPALPDAPVDPGGVAACAALHP